jgi:Lrp/AsnC family leucine-responsive transcriptional regulator
MRWEVNTENEKSALDAVDKQLLTLLQEDGRISNVELARRVNLSPPATHARVKRLEQGGNFAALCGFR